MDIFSDNDKYKKFLKFLKQALTEETVIQQRIQEIAANTQDAGRMLESAGFADDKQVDRDFDKNKKIKDILKEQTKTIEKLQNCNKEQADKIDALREKCRQQAEQLQELQRECDLQAEEKKKLEAQVDEQLWQLKNKNNELQAAQSEIDRLQQLYQQLHAEKETQTDKLAQLQKKLSAWEREFAEPAKFYRLYKSLPQGIRGRFTDIIADSSIVAFISTGSNIEYVEMFWDSMKRNYAELGAEREALLQIFAYLLELCNAYQGEQVYELLDDEIGKGFDDDVHMRSENCSKYSGKIEKVLLPGIWNKRSERANKKALVEWQ